MLQRIFSQQFINQTSSNTLFVVVNVVVVVAVVLVIRSIYINLQVDDVDVSFQKLPVVIVTSWKSCQIFLFRRRHDERC